MKIAVLGATGSIGTTCLNGIRSNQLPLTVAGVSAYSSRSRLLSIGEEFSCPALIRSEDKATLREFLEKIRPDIVLNAIAGFDGLEATVVSLEMGIDVALANKESVVSGHSVIFDLAGKNNAKIYPVDSEHSAIYSLVNAHGIENVSKLIITASGGPFRNLPIEDFSGITVEKALNHPTWKMGKKITIDSSSLANKALEVIEAAYLFGFDGKDIEVTVHPQSVVHSMIRLFNGAVYAQMSPPDMTLPILGAIAHGEFPLHDVVKPLDFTLLDLSFRKPDLNKFPLLKCAWDILDRKGSYSIAFNAADEVAVHAFLDRKISYMKMQQTVLDVLDMDWSMDTHSYDEIVEVDRLARIRAREVL